MSIIPVVKRARSLDEGQTLRPHDKILSDNMVTGMSLNLPIYNTCKPTKVCAANCYAQRNHISFNAAVNKQIKVMNSLKEAPHEIATRIVAEIKKTSATFLRWNGVGDLFAESIECLTAVADHLPAMPIWVVTRIPEQAASVPHRDNVYVHFSLDASSLDRYEQVLALNPMSRNLFFSFQEDVDATPPRELEDIPISVYFTDRYKRPAPADYNDVSCPLNAAESTTGACAKCRRCFSSAALRIKERRT